MEFWNGYEKQTGTFEGHQTIVVLADSKNRTQNWMMKMEYWDAFPGIELAMVAQGWNLVYVENDNRWACSADLERKKRYAAFIHNTFGWNAKFTCVGMSCGGLFSVQFAARYPELVQAMYLDAPVLNLLSCPADLGKAKGGMWDEYAAATGMTMSKLICSREHPIDHLPILSSYRIPVALVYGTDDQIVPYEENGALLRAFYEAHDLPLLAIGKEGCDHHPHGLEDPAPVVEFLLTHAQ